VIAVHGVFYRQARNKYVTVKPRNGFVWNHEAISVVVQHETPAYFVVGESFFACASMSFAAARRIRLTGSLRRFSAAFSRGIPAAFATSQAVAAAGHFIDGAPFFEFAKHFEQAALVGLSQVQSPRNLPSAGRISRNLQKTKNIVGI
jgi:hypothetical protein